MGYDVVALGELLIDFTSAEGSGEAPVFTANPGGAPCNVLAMLAKLGRSTRPDIHLGVCGEHGGDPSSIEFFHQAGLDYVSCSPFRVPIARLAAAHAAIKYPRKK